MPSHPSPSTTSSTRRQFLQTSAAAAAAVAAAGLVVPARHALADEPKADPAAPSANERIGVVVMGLRGRGGTHLGAFLGSPDSEVVGLCDVDARVLAKCAAEVAQVKDRKPRLEQDIRKLLDDPSVDAVSIATPNHWHALAAIWAIQAGKDVYVEKPASHNVSEGRRLVEFAQHHKKIVQHGTQSRSDGAVRNAIKFIHDGKIGPVRLARALCYKRRGSIGDVAPGQPVDKEIDYNLWLGPAPEKPVERQQFHYDWHWQWDYGNGDMGNQGVHQMDVALWGLNKQTLADRVQCVGGRVGYADDGQTPNTMATMLDYDDDKSRIIFEVRGLETAALQGVTVGNFFYGSEGYVVIGSGAPKAYNYKGELLEVFGSQGGTDHFRNFLAAVKSRKTEDQNAGVLECHLSSGLCHQGNISYLLGSKQSYSAVAAPFASDESGSETLKRMGMHLSAAGVDLSQQEYYLGRKLAFDAKAERFTGDGADEANAMLTRQYRMPFVVPDKA